MDLDRFHHFSGKQMKVLHPCPLPTPIAGLDASSKACGFQLIYVGAGTTDTKCHPRSQLVVKFEINFGRISLF